MLIEDLGVGDPSWSLAAGGLDPSWSVCGGPSWPSEYKSQHLSTILEDVPN